MIGIVLGFEIENQWRVSDDAQSRRRKQRSLVAMRSILAQYSSRRPGAVGQVIGHGIQQTLNAVRSLQDPQLSEFG